MIHLDGIVGTLSNATTGMGDPQYDPTQAFRLRMMPDAGMSEEEQSEVVRRFGLLRKVVTTIPKAATTRWGEVTLTQGKRDQIDRIATALATIPVSTLTRRYSGARKAFQVGLIEAFRTGNAGLILDVDDGREPNEAIDLRNIRSLRKIFVMNRWSLVPDMLNGRGRLTHYQVTQTAGLYAQRARGYIHHSRVLWLSGADTDDMAHAHNGGCDDSILEGVIRAFVLYLSGVEGAARMIQDFDVMVHKIQGLMNDFGLCAKDPLSATAGGESSSRTVGEKLSERLRLNQRGRSLYRGYAIDKDAEDMTQISRSASGYSDLVEMLKVFLQSSTEYPPAILFGEFSSGIDASGKGQEEKELWNETVGQVQTDKLDHLMIGSVNGDDPSPGLLQILCLAKDGPTKGKIPDGMGWRWLEIYPPSPSEKADLEQKRSQIVQTLAGLDPNFAPQAILSHYGGAEYTPTVTLSPEYRALLEKTAKEVKGAEDQEPQEPQEGQPEASDPEPSLLDELTDAQIENLDPEDAARILEQEEGRADAEDLHADSVPAEARALCSSALAREQGHSNRFVPESYRAEVQSIAQGLMLSHQQRQRVAQWLENHRAYSHLSVGSPRGRAYRMMGGAPMLKWLRSQSSEES